MSTLTETLSFICSQYSSLPLLVSAETCAGKTYIVTGANNGLGYEAAKHLVQLGSQRVIIAVRSVPRGQGALDKIEAETGIRGVGQVWQLDLSSYESIIAFCGRVEKDLGRIDGIIQNAAAAATDWVNCEGWESHIMVNLLGTVLLSLLIMPYLESCARKLNIKPRLTIVISGMAFTQQGDLSLIEKRGILRDVNDPNKWNIQGTNRYSLSKLLQIFAYQRLASLAPASRTGVVINLVSPGLCKTGLARYSDSATQRQLNLLTAVLGRSAEWEVAISFMVSLPTRRAMAKTWFLAGYLTKADYGGEIRFGQKWRPSWRAFVLDAQKC